MAGRSPGKSLRFGFASLEMGVYVGSPQLVPGRTKDVLPGWHSPGGWFPRETPPPLFTQRSHPRIISERFGLGSVEIIQNGQRQVWPPRPGEAVIWLDRRWGWRLATIGVQPLRRPAGCNGPKLFRCKMLAA